MPKVWISAKLSSVLLELVGRKGFPFPVIFSGPGEQRTEAFSCRGIFCLCLPLAEVSLWGKGPILAHELLGQPVPVQAFQSPSHFGCPSQEDPRPNSSASGLPLQPGVSREPPPEAGPWRCLPSQREGRQRCRRKGRNVQRRQAFLWPSSFLGTGHSSRPLGQLHPGLLPLAEGTP